MMAAMVVSWPRRGAASNAQLSGVETQPFSEMSAKGPRVGRECRTADRPARRAVEEAAGQSAARPRRVGGVDRVGKTTLRLPVGRDPDGNRAWTARSFSNPLGSKSLRGLLNVRSFGSRASTFPSQNSVLTALLSLFQRSRVFLGCSMTAPSSLRPSPNPSPPTPMERGRASEVPQRNR